MSYDIRTDGSTSVGPEGVYLVWVWYHGSVSAERCDSLEEALRRYAALSEEDCSVQCVDGPAGVVADFELDLWDEGRRARRQVEWQRQRAGEMGRVSYGVQVRNPQYPNESDEIESFDDLSDAVEFMGQLNRPGRVRIMQRVVGERGRVMVDWAAEDEGQVAA
ncbi:MULTISPECIES: hypothetical protein [Nocardia]|uniref:hypothetical protein n=1 Tax=Nocardia TaxID=1817 RepID=UPI000D6968A6|nr:MULTISPECIES: hypothetical protein [Nocardia]